MYKSLKETESKAITKNEHVVCFLSMLLLNNKREHPVDKGNIMIKLVLLSTLSVMLLSGCVWYDDDWYDHDHRYSYGYDYDHRRPSYGYEWNGRPEYRPPQNRPPENRPPEHRPPQSRPPENRPPGHRPDRPNYKQTKPLPH